MTKDDDSKPAAKPSGPRKKKAPASQQHFFGTLSDPRSPSFADVGFPATNTRSKRNKAKRNPTQPESASSTSRRQELDRIRDSVPDSPRPDAATRPPPGPVTDPALASPPDQLMDTSASRPDTELMDPPTDPHTAPTQPQSNVTTPAPPTRADHSQAATLSDPANDLRDRVTTSLAQLDHACTTHVARISAQGNDAKRELRILAASELQKVTTAKRSLADEITRANNRYNALEKRTQNAAATEDSLQSLMTTTENARTTLAAVCKTAATRTEELHQANERAQIDITNKAEKLYESLATCAQNGITFIAQQRDAVDDLLVEKLDAFDDLQTEFLCGQIRNILRTDGLDALSTDSTTSAQQVAALATTVAELTTQVSRLQAQLRTYEDRETQLQRLPELERKLNRFTEMEEQLQALPALDEKLARLADLETKLERLDDMEDTLRRYEDMEQYLDHMGGLDDIFRRLDEMPRIRGGGPSLNDRPPRFRPGLSRRYPPYDDTRPPSPTVHTDKFQQQSLHLRSHVPTDVMAFYNQLYHNGRKCGIRLVAPDRLRATDDLCPVDVPPDTRADMANELYMKFSDPDVLPADTKCKGLLTQFSANVDGYAVLRGLLLGSHPEFAAGEVTVAPQWSDSPDLYQLAGQFAMFFQHESANRGRSYTTYEQSTLYLQALLAETPHVVCAQSIKNDLVKTQPDVSPEYHLDRLPHTIQQQSTPDDFPLPATGVAHRVSTRSRSNDQPRSSPRDRRDGQRRYRGRTADRPDTRPSTADDRRTPAKGTRFRTGDPTQCPGCHQWGHQSNNCRILAQVYWAMQYIESHAQEAQKIAEAWDTQNTRASRTAVVRTLISMNAFDDLDEEYTEEELLMHDAVVDVDFDASLQDGQDF